MGPFARVRIKVSECQPSPTLVVEFCLSKFYNSLIWKTSLPLPQTQLCSTAGAERLLPSTRVFKHCLYWPINIQPMKHLEYIPDDIWYKCIMGIVYACMHTCICTDILFYMFFCRLFYTDWSCTGAWKGSSLCQNILSARKVFFKVYKVCKNMYQQNSLHNNIKISRETPNYVFTLSSFN